MDKKPLHFPTFIVYKKAVSIASLYHNNWITLSLEVRSFCVSPDPLTAAEVNEYIILCHFALFNHLSHQVKRCLTIHLHKKGREGGGEGGNRVLF